jgi:hypothetical protein
MTGGAEATCVEWESDRGVIEVWLPLTGQLYLLSKMTGEACSKTFEKLAWFFIFKHIYG